MKISATRRALILANIFNSLVALYFIIIAIVALAQLRWYHQLTITVKVRHILTLTTSYFAFILLIFVGLILLGLFVSSALRLNGNGNQNKRHQQQQQQLPPASRSLSPNLEAEQANENNNNNTNEIFTDVSRVEFDVDSNEQQQARRTTTTRRTVVLRDLSLSEESNSSVCCSILVHLVATIGLIVILLIWLFNTGELVRDSISTQLDYALARYQFSNRSNYYSIAIDGIQDINNCCGSLEYSDFPRQRISGLSAGLYPGSCCGKSVFGVNANQHCRAEEIWRAKQTVSKAERKEERKRERGDFSAPK